MRVSKELRALLKVAHKAHPELQVLLIDLMQYQPKLLVNERCAARQELEMHEELTLALEEWLVDKLLDDMIMGEAALQQPVHLSPKVRFALGKAVHVQFDRGA